MLHTQSHKEGVVKACCLDVCALFAGWQCLRLKKAGVNDLGKEILATRFKGCNLLNVIL